MPSKPSPTLDTGVGLWDEGSILELSQPKAAPELELVRRQGTTRRTEPWEGSAFSASQEAD